MSNVDPMKPLFDDPLLGDELRSALDAASEHQPSSEELARLKSKLAAALPPGTLPPAAGPGGGGSPGGGPSPAAPLMGKGLAAIVAASAIVVVVGVYELTRGGTTTTVVTPMTSAAPSTSASPLTATAATSVSPIPTVEVDAATTATNTTKPLTSVATASATASALPAEPEASMLARAHQALLHHDPDRALAVAGEHARSYPQGALTQEREVIAVEALLALGRRDEARARVATFRREHPKSSHLSRLERLVEGP